MYSVRDMLTIIIWMLDQKRLNQGFINFYKMKKVYKNIKEK
jgi:hypothetical protein